jgi:hypothetical protein
VTDVVALTLKCKQADNQMRDRFRDLRLNLVTPRLPGISAFGTRMAIYEYVAVTNTLMPGCDLPDPVCLNDVAPAEMTFSRSTVALRCVSEDVRAMCQALNN